MWLEVESDPKRRWKTWIFAKPKFFGFNYDPGVKELFYSRRIQDLVFYRKLELVRQGTDKDLQHLIRAIFRYKINSK